MNEIYFFILMLLSLSIMGGASLFGRNWVYIIFVTIYLLNNIVVGKMTGFFDMNTTVAVGIFPALFLGTDVLSEFYGKKSARKAIWLGLFSNLVFILLGQATLVFDTTTPEYASALETIFNFVPRILAASLFTYVISQNIDVTIFHRIREFTGEKHLWLRNLVSTTVAQLIDSVLFITLAFGFIENWSDLILSIWAIKILMALIDTPIIYIVKGLYTRFPRLHRADWE